ncbi:hypothetical protein [Usitatibacter palustris]|uniref:Uncharacterized protein n=1 Tax=Usitatibacter palustris TaxID=2732487 RepID=A0A6M4H4Z8_9PROT|nr:hypothetical protein [Usitatibacter palustris]QJR13773.1 hypothetical protein DSM104440_00563 [Usitatibacter palustris]
MRFKLQVQEDEKDPRQWHDVNASDGSLLVFDDESVARSKLEELYPILVKMERFEQDTKRTRVLRIIEDDDD